MQIENISPSDLCPHYKTYCPCILTEVSQCPLCGQLGEVDTCDCHWPGRCIFLEKRDPIEAPIVAKGYLQHAQNFYLPANGVLYFAFTHSETIADLSLFSSVHVIHQDPPVYLKIPGVIVNINKELNLITVALNVTSIREKYYLQNYPSMQISYSSQPAILGLDRLSYQDSTLIIASGYGTLLIKALVSNFKHAAIQVEDTLPPLLDKQLETVPRNNTTLTSYNQLIILENYHRQKKRIKSIKLHPSLKISLLNNNLFI
ncbi:hypothetical protein MFMK1_001765 [Metallumcola ferriviriculae]|uniref:Uncharacterized protein n=1 Tax=Metallumcola ferriviriculae TaxID=3039180 RepID=A0AAU0UP17_9FIRM|nr:hypothetical protein MFMK1_001765 [Desulfitibacteraceae bacterium MK1]